MLNFKFTHDYSVIVIFNNHAILKQIEKKKTFTLFLVYLNYLTSFKVLTTVLMVYLDIKYVCLFVLYLEMNLIAKTFKNQTTKFKLFQ